MNLFERVFTELNKEKVQYLVVGGVAVNLHGFLRFTGDLDIIILLEEKNLKKIEKVMKKLDYCERLPISIMELRNEKQVKKWLEEKNMKAFTFFPKNNNPLQIDIIIEESLQFKKIYPKKIIKTKNSIKIPVISINDLITMKKKANRKQDIMDLESLLELKGL